MKELNVLILRAVVGLIFAFLLLRVFYPEASAITAVGLGIVLVGLAYLFDYLRSRKSGS